VLGRCPLRKQSLDESKPLTLVEAFTLRFVSEVPLTQDCRKASRVPLQRASYVGVQLSEERWIRIGADARDDLACIRPLEVPVLTEVRLDEQFEWRSQFVVHGSDVGVSAQARPQPSGPVFGNDA
jgi:hypothetical protein